MGGSSFVNSLVTVALAIVGVAIVAVLVSKNANTSGVLSSAGGAFSKALSTAEAPVTGSGGGLGNLGGGFPGGGGDYISN